MILARDLKVGDTVMFAGYPITVTYVHLHDAGKAPWRAAVTGTEWSLPNVHIGFVTGKNGLHGELDAISSCEFEEES